MGTNPKRARAYAYLLINTVTWGAALPLVKFGLPFTTPFRYLFYRYCIAVLCSIPIFWYYRKIIAKHLTSLPAILGTELIGTTLALSLLYLGLSRTSALEASFIATTSPIFLTIGSIFFLREREERHEWMGLILAFLGTALLVLLPYLAGNVHADGSLSGNILVLLQNIAIVAYFILAKRHYKKLPKLLVAAISFVVGVVSFFLLSLFEAAGSLTSFSRAVEVDLLRPEVWFIAVYMAVFGSIVGLTAYIKGQDAIEVSEAGLFTYLQPIVAIPLTYVLFQETLTIAHVVAGTFVILGVLIAESRSLR